MDGRYTLRETTEDEEDRREVARMLVPLDPDIVRLNYINSEQAAIGPDKTMLDDICVWLAQRKNVDESDIWDE